jgi:Protein of unknown function (DUF3300)
MTMRTMMWLLLALSVPVLQVRLSAQVLLSPNQLDQLVASVALYPDTLLAQVLAAATYPEQIPEAAQWADGHSYLQGDALAQAISEDNLPWDPSVLALLPFPSVLDRMASDMPWTRQLGDAVLSQRADVMDAVQRERQTARNFGYLLDTAQYRVVVSAPGIIEILPTNPAIYYVPVYDPLVVFSRRRVGGAAAITFGPRVTIGAAFAPLGWRDSHFSWPAHTLFLNNHPWIRTRENRATYTHPYAVPHRPAEPRVEHHELRPTHEPRREEPRREEERRR